MLTIALSPAALSLLRRRIARERVEVTEETRTVYLELAEAGLVIPLHTMTGGDESAHALTTLTIFSITSRFPTEDERKSVVD